MTPTSVRPPRAVPTPISSGSSIFRPTKFQAPLKPVQTRSVATRSPTSAAPFGRPRRQLPADRGARLLRSVRSHRDRGPDEHHRARGRVQREGEGHAVEVEQPAEREAPGGVGEALPSADTAVVRHPLFAELDQRERVDVRPRRGHGERDPDGTERHADERVEHRRHHREHDHPQESELQRPTTPDPVSATCPRSASRRSAPPPSLRGGIRSGSGRSLVRRSRSRGRGRTTRRSVRT